MTLQTRFTKRREYYFWAIVSCLMLHNTLPEGAAERKLFGTLAYRMIEKARNDTPADTTVIPARGIQTGQEVGLLLDLIPFVVSEEPGKKALEVLESKNLGVDSTVGKTDWWGLARRRLDLLEELGEWKVLYKICKGLLPKRDQEKKEEEKQNGDSAHKQEISGRGDDWRVWKGFVDAAGKLYDEGDKEVSKEALEQILEHRKFAASGTSRNGDLALVKFASLFHDKNDGPEGTPTLQEAIEGYFDRICTKTCCFEDLQEYLEMLEDVEQKDFLRHVSSHISAMPEETEVFPTPLPLFTHPPNPQIETKTRPPRRHHQPPKIHLPPHYLPSSYRLPLHNKNPHYLFHHQPQYLHPLPPPRHLPPPHR